MPTLIVVAAIMLFWEFFNVITGEPEYVLRPLHKIIATAVVGSVTHLRRGNVDVKTVAWVAPFAVVASFGAAFLADALDAQVLRRIFAVVIVFFALQMIVGALRREQALIGERESG